MIEDHQDPRSSGSSIIRIFNHQGLCAMCLIPVVAHTPYKFKIIRDSWNSKDKQDARNMAKALWVYIVTGEFGIPMVIPYYTSLNRL